GGGYTPSTAFTTGLAAYNSTGSAVGTNDPMTWKQGLNSVIPYVDNVTNMLLTANTPQVEKPTFTKPMSLDTDYNVNPQIGTIRDAVNTGNKAIQDNTSSSNVARSNLTANKLAGAKEVNAILASKQNAETNLRNQQAQVTYQHQAMDAAKMDQYAAKNRVRANAIQGKISQNVAQGVDDYLRAEDNKAKEAYQNKQLDLEA